MRTLVPRPLAGVDRSKKSHVSATGLYDVLNLRPFRGRLEQTNLVGMMISQVSDQDYWIFEVEP